MSFAKTSLEKKTDKPAVAFADEVGKVKDDEEVVISQLEYKSLIALATENGSGFPRLGR